jgi:G:T-mismatch repair DNA endonuclease (very short patch repair protein)
MTNNKETNNTLSDLLLDKNISFNKNVKTIKDKSRVKIKKSFITIYLDGRFYWDHEIEKENAFAILNHWLEKEIIIEQYPTLIVNMINEMKKAGMFPTDYKF